MMTRSIRFIGCAAAAALLLIWTPPAPAATVTWSFQQVDDGGNPEHDVLAMSIGTGAKWPAVFYKAAHESLVAASLSPAGWLPSCLDSSSYTYWARSEAGQDGRVGVAWVSPVNGVRNIQFAQSTSPGWPTSTVASFSGAVAGLDVAYLSGNRPVVAFTDDNVNVMKVGVYGAGAWDIESAGPGYAVSVAVDGGDNIGLAYCSAYSDELYLAMKEPGGGMWDISAPIAECSWPSPAPSLAFNAGDEPGIAFFTDWRALDFTSFDVQSGQWQSGSIASDVASTRVNLVYNSLGHAAVAYVGTDQQVHYRINDGGGWADIILPSGTDPVTGLPITPSPYTPAVLAFDCNDLPVIAYYRQGYGVVLAYDPVVTPEPASLVLLMAAGVVALGPRRWNPNHRTRPDAPPVDAGPRRLKPVARCSRATGHDHLV